MSFLTNEQAAIINGWLADAKAEGYKEGYEEGYEAGINAVEIEADSETQDPAEVFTVNNCIVDISAFQKNINFDELCDKADFVILRARCCDKTDNSFEQRAAELNKRDMPFAVYDYAMLRSHAHAKEQAEVLYKLCSKYNPRIYYIDTEKLSSHATYATEMEYIKTYVARLKELGAKVVGQYTGDWLYSTYYKKLQDIFDTLWIASYGKDSGQDEGVILKSAQYTDKIDLHQYTSKGVLPGISTKGDLSHITGHKPLSWFTGRNYN